MGKNLFLTAAATLMLATLGGAAAASGTGESASTGEAASPNEGSATTLRVVAPTGAHYRLAFVAGPGWRFIDSLPGADLVKVASNGVVPTPQSDGVGGDQPQSVFIDGPTGYTFAWSAERGWYFVGHIAGAEH
jgi:hypothetical protein